MSNRRNRDRDKGSLRNLQDLPKVSYEEAANATYGGRKNEAVNQWFGDIDPSTITESGIQVAADGALRAYDFRMTEIGLDPENMSLDEENWKQLGQVLFRFDKSIQWLIGDWLLYGENNKWGEMLKIAEEMGYEVATLYDYKYVAQHVNFSVRTENLSFGHHKLVSKLDAEQQQYWLEKAAYGDVDDATQTAQSWSISRLREEMKGKPKTENDSSFDRNLQRIDREITKQKWQRLASDERLKRHEYLQSILNRMEDWGFD
jgi:hypothetical protein